MLVCLVFYFGALCGLLRLFSCFQPGLSGIRYFVILGCIFSSTLINDRADAFYLKKEFLSCLSTTIVTASKRGVG
jgi:hypothetical protein